MDDQNLDHLLAQLRAAPPPAVLASFQQDVWREICQRKTAAERHYVAWFGWLLEPLLRPAMALAALALALVMGVGLGTTARPDSRNMETRLALNLQVFGSSSPSLPSTLMGYTK